MQKLTASYQYRQAIKIEATPVTRFNLEEVVEWVHGIGFWSTASRFIIKAPHKKGPGFQTFEGRWDDWIVKDEEGAFYLYGSDAFKRRFEPLGIDDEDKEDRNDPFVVQYDKPWFDH